MPAPKFLAGLPKPLLFALYGAAGGLLGALVFAEPLYRILTPPPPPPPAAPEAQLAVAASKDVEVFVSGRNTFPVQIARDGFEGPVTVRIDELPPGVTAAAVTIPAGASESAVLVAGGPTASPVAARSARVVVEAAVGGTAVTAGTPITFKVTDPPKPLADVVFVLDVTSSMQWAIDDLKNGIARFADSLGKARIDFRLGLVTFQDVYNDGEKVEVIQFKGGPFTADAATFRDEVSKLKADGGGDIPESSLEAVTEACKLPFRKDATKVLLLITDAPPKVVPAGDTANAVATTANLVRGANVDALHVVGLRFDKGVYAPLLAAGADKAGGNYFDLKDVVIGDEGFDGLLDRFGGVVSAAASAKNPDVRPQVAEKINEAPKLGVKSLQSSEQTAAGSEGRIVLRSGVWTGAIAALVCLTLLGGQHHYLRGSLPAVGGVLAGLVGGLAVGLVGGAAGQGLYMVAKGGETVGLIFQVLGWALLGGMAGVGLSLFVPNMKWALGLAGGAIGGAVGCAGYLLVTKVAGDLVGRLVGGLALGFCIGLMVAVAETAFRRAWLEVRYGDRETITVTLGPEPVKVGSDAKACTVWARGAAPVALRFFVRDGKVVCDDTALKRETAVGNGFAKEVGTLTVTVHTGSGTPAPPPAPRQKVRAQPSTKAVDDDGFDLPMPVASSPPRAPAPPPPVPPRVPAPVVTAPPPIPRAPAPPKPPPVPATKSKPVPPAPPRIAAPVPPAAPVTKPAAKTADGCPSCGRVVAGKPGARYCMICDQTY